MEIELQNNEKLGFFARGLRWFTSLLLKFKTEVLELFKNAKKIGEDDPRKIVHSLKVGLALTLLSLFYYLRPLYDDFGVAGIWAVLTVVVIFDFSVGATLSKGLNRAFATLLAGALGIGAHYLASLSGGIGEPIILGIFVFLLAAASTFSRFIPWIKLRYDYGVMIFILTFSLVAVSSFRVDEIIALARQRLSTVAIGGFTCIAISMFICPVWAGEDLHKLVALNLEKLANFLQGFSEVFFENDGEGKISKDVEPLHQGYKSVLTSKTTEESLANFARWEPRHGPFKFCHPWKQYLKIGTLVRQCAYNIEALNGCINTGAKIPPEFRGIIQASCKTMSSESGKALTGLAFAIRTMTKPSSADCHVLGSQIASKDLKTALKTAFSEDIVLLEIVPAATIASLLVEIVDQVEQITESVNELAGICSYKNVNMVSDQKPQPHHRTALKPVCEAKGLHVIITIPPASTEVSNTHNH